ARPGRGGRAGGAGQPSRVPVISARSTATQAVVRQTRRGKPASTPVARSKRRSAAARLPCSWSGSILIVLSGGLPSRRPFRIFRGVRRLHGAEQLAEPRDRPDDGEDWRPPARLELLVEPVAKSRADHYAKRQRNSCRREAERRADLSQPAFFPFFFVMRRVQRHRAA